MANVRGCATEWSIVQFDACASAEYCQSLINIMDRPGCSSEIHDILIVVKSIFPLARCHVCAATGNATECSIQPNAAPSLCPTFNANDRCFFLRHGETIERGCVSSESLCSDPSNYLLF